MRVVRKFLLIFAMVAGLSIGVAAQQHDDGKKPPPKNPPPKVNPQPKPPPDSNKPKRPGEAMAVIWIREDEA
jgi:hypothetical protein